MPITAKLSRRFYERFGDDIVNELVEWLNAVDTSYRQEFKDLFEANFNRLEARVDAKLEAMKSELLRWLFLFWIGTMGSILAILKL
jgi:hypothetical protein